MTSLPRFTATLSCTCAGRGLVVEGCMTRLVVIERGRFYFSRLLSQSRAGWLLALSSLSVSCEPQTIISVGATADGGPESLRAAITRANAAAADTKVRIE